MFSSFAYLKDCVLATPSPLSQKSLDHLMDFFCKKEERSMFAFVRSLQAPSVLPKELDKVVGSGGYGVVYDDTNGNAVKFYCEDNNYWICNDIGTLESFVENIMFYTLFKAILAKAYTLGFTTADYSKSILDIDNVFAKPSRHGKSFIVGYTTKLHTGKWNERFAPQIFQIIEEINNLTKYGIYLVHGDLTLDNIVVTDKGVPLLIDFDIASVAIELGPSKTTSKQRRLARRAEERGEAFPWGHIISLVQYTSEVIINLAKGTKRQDFVLIDLVIFGCRDGIIDESSRKLAEIFGELEGDSDDRYKIAYKNFVGKPEIEFEVVRDVLMI